MSTNPLPRYPVFDRIVKPKIDLLVIIIIIFIILVIAICIVIYAIYRPSAGTSVGRCGVGLCAVNLSTGVKRCPADPNGQVTYDIVFEDCTSANYCQSKKAPCAVLPGGTLDCTGVCGQGNDECACVSKPNVVN